MKFCAMSMVLPLLFTLSRSAEAQGCGAGCKETKKSIESIPAAVTFDANTGELLEGGLRFRHTNNVQIVFDRKNPFKYAYRFSVRASALESGIARGFLGLIPGFSEVLDSAISGKLLAADSARANALPQSCNGKLDPLSAAAKLSQGVKEQADSFKKLYDQYQAFYKRTDTADLLGSNNSCDICAEAGKLEKELAGRKGAEAFEKLLQQLNAELDKPLSKQALGDLKGLAQCKADLENLTGSEKLIPALEADQTKYNALLPKIKEAEASFAAIQELIGTVLSDPNAFWQRKVVSIPSEATQVTVSIARKNIREKDAPFSEIAVHSIQVGESRLHLTAGVGWSTIDDVMISRVPGLNENKEVIQQFGYQENSKYRPSGIVNLNIPVWDLNKAKTVSFGPALGLVVSGRGESVQAEYFGGAGFGFRQDLVFLNIGLHSARVQQLGGGFKIGDPVPATITDPLPIQKDWKPGLMISLTIRLSPR